MAFNAEQIAYDLRAEHRSLETKILANLDLVELDEFEIESLAPHWEELCALGVGLHTDKVQLTINGYPQNLESAILYVLDLQAREPFNDPAHATRTFVKALTEGWKPSKQKQASHPQR